MPAEKDWKMQLGASSRSVLSRAPENIVNVLSADMAMSGIIMLVTVCLADLPAIRRDADPDRRLRRAALMRPQPARRICRISSRKLVI